MQRLPRPIKWGKNKKKTNTWRLNNTLQNNQEITEEIKEEIKKYLETNDNENRKTYRWPRDTGKDPQYH